MFSIKDGLSQGLINGILQDKEGYIWFATKDGLNRYDGYNVTVFKHNPHNQYSLPYNHVMEMKEDEYGNFWLNILNHGVYLFDKKTESFYPAIQSKKSTTSENDYSRLVHAEKGILVVNYDDEVFVYSMDTVNLCSDPLHIQEKIKPVFRYKIKQSYESYQLTMFDKTLFAKLLTYCSFTIGDETTLYSAEPYYEKNVWYVRALKFPSEKRKQIVSGNFYLSSLSKLNKHAYYLNNNAIIDYNWEKNTRQHVALLPKLEFPKFSSLFVLPNGNLYIRDYNAYYLYDTVKKTLSRLLFQDGKQELSMEMKVPYVDANGIAWYGTAGFGLFKSDSKKLRFNTVKSHVNTGIYFQQHQPYIKPLPSNCSVNFNHNQIVLDKTGTYWMIENASQYLFSYNTMTSKFTKYPGLVHDHVFPFNLYCDHNDRLWCFSDQGADKKMIYQLDKQKGIPIARYQIPIDKELNEYNFISQWWQDERGIIWLGTIRGLYSFNPEALNEQYRWHHWQHVVHDSTTLSEDMIFSICADPKEPQKYLWVGTNGGGINRFEFASGKCIHYTEENGLPNNVVYGILSDRENNLWLSTNRGLSCFNSSLKSFVNFVEEDGLQGDEFNRYEFMYCNNGDLFFGGVNGYTIFNPKTVLQKQKQAPMVFTGLSISNKPIQWNLHQETLNEPIGYTKTITLQPGQSIFSISFATLEFRSNQKKLYSYRLMGFDSKWTEPSPKNEATFTDLSPGTYTLNVTGTNTDGVWNSKGISMQIVILPKWYQTWWFRISMGLFLGGLIYVFYRYKITQQTKLLTMRNSIAADLHDEMGSTLSSISLFSNVANMLVKDNKEASSLLQKINNNALEVLDTMSDIVWAINTTNDNLNNLINRMHALAVELSVAKQFQLHFNAHQQLPDKVLDAYQKKNLYLIFKETINNAAKYSECKHVWIEFSLDKNIFFMSIKDDGKGFEMSHIVLEPKHRGGGNGLFNMKKRAENLHAEIKINSAVGMGTEIQFKIKLKG